MPRALTLTFAVVLALMAHLPAASAGSSDDPELTDGCGSVAADPVVLPGIDLCAGWFTTRTGGGGPAAVDITLQFAEDYDARHTATTLFAWWRSGDCTYEVVLTDEGDLYADPGVRFQHLCGGAAVFESVDVHDDTVVIDGPLVTARLVFDGVLAPFAEDFGAGDVLEDLSVRANGTQGVWLGAACFEDTCGHWLYESADGARPYTIQNGDGPPAAPAFLPAQCVAGLASVGGPSTPALTDPARDNRAVDAYPRTGGAAFDIRAGWWGLSDDGAVTFSVLPAGPQHGQGELRYLIEYNQTHAEIISVNDGSWTGLVYANTDDPAAINYPGQQADVTHDPETGLVTIELPEAHLPQPGDPLQLDLVYSHFNHYGAVVGDPTLQSSGGVDTSNNGTVCTMTR